MLTKNVYLCKHLLPILSQQYMNIRKIKYFLLVGMWKEENEARKGIVGRSINWLRKLWLAILFFIRRGHSDYATALSFSTLLAIVPVFAVVFAIARGFDLSIYIEDWFRNLMSSQPQVAESVIELANSYLKHAKSGVIIGIGLIFMFYSVLSLIYNVEYAFDQIWQVKDKRSPTRILIDYMALLFLVPIIIIIISGLNIFFYTIAGSLESYAVLGPMAKFLIKLVPYVLMPCFFIAFYVIMPNTKVHVSKAIVPGIIAGLAMIVLQYFYIHGQILLTSYNAIYGSFAALPLFMLWILISWYICLFCAELCYMNQNMDYYAFLIETKDVSYGNQMLMSATLLSIICQRFAEGKAPLTALQLKEETKIPIRVTTDLLFRMRDVNLLTEISGNGDQEPVFQPAQDIANITIGKMKELLDAYPRDKQRKIDTKIASLLSEETMSRLKAAKNEYLKALGEIPVKELCK